MSDDDKTEKLPENVDDASGRPSDQMHEMTNPLYALQKQMLQLTGMIESLDSKVDARLHDTRPLWEGVQSRLESIENQLGEISGKLERLEPDVKEIKRNQRALNDNFLSLQGRQSETEERVDNLEKRVS
jgi:chromosome segregation ATPase